MTGTVFIRPSFSILRKCFSPARQPTIAILVTYGGILMTLPPRRLFDVWADTDYDFAESKAERLLMVALDYSVERFVVYVAARPPRSIFRSIAAQVGRKILYLPIGALSPAKLKKLRVVHVLDSYERRTEAKDYLW